MKKYIKLLLLFTLFCVLLTSNSYCKWDLSLERIIAPSNNPEIQYNIEPGIRSIPLTVWVKNYGDEQSPDFIINYVIARQSDQLILYQGNKEVTGLQAINEHRDTVITVFEITDDLQPDIYTVLASISYPDLPPNSEDSNLSNNEYPRDNDQEYIFTVTDEEPPEEAKLVYDIYSPKSNEDGFYYSSQEGGIPFYIGITNNSQFTLDECEYQLNIISDEDNIYVWVSDGDLIGLRPYQTKLIDFPSIRLVQPGIYRLLISDCLKQGFPEDTNKYKFEIRDTVHIGDFDLLQVYSPLPKSDTTYSIYDSQYISVRVLNTSPDTIYNAKFKAQIRSQYNVPIYSSEDKIMMAIPGEQYNIFFPDKANLSFGDNKLAIEYMQTNKELIPTLLSPGEEYIVYAEDISSITEYDDSFLIYPNPFKEQISLNLKEFSGKQITFSLYNSLGNIIIEENTLYSDTQLELKIPTELLSGIYTYKITSGQEIITGKLIKIE